MIPKPDFPSGSRAVSHNWSPPHSAGLLSHPRPTIVNISSIRGQITFPLGTLYHGTKAAVEGLSEALHHQLEPLGNWVCIVQPGMIRTDFGGRSFDFAMDETLADYAPTAEVVGRLFGKLAANPSAPEVVAGVIWDAVNKTGDLLGLCTGPDV